MRLRKLFEPRMDAPLPLWMIFPVIFVALYLTHLTLLRLPYYWDEAGYYIPAAWDFFRTGSLIPSTTLSNAHPPLPSVYLALWWKASGYMPEVTREAVLIVASFGLLGVWRLALALHSSRMVAFWTVVLTGLYPIWFAQSTLAHADIFAAACTLWGMVYALPDENRKPHIAAVWFMAAALSKETAIFVPLTLAAIHIVHAIRKKESVAACVKEAAWLVACIVPLGGWYAWHYAKTGFLFGNPEFLRYNAEANVDPLRFLAAFGHRILHLTAHMNMFVPVLLTCAALMLAPRVNADGREREGLSTGVRMRIFILLLVNAVLFSVLGGALLCRYLLPMYPLILLLAVSTFRRRVPFWHALAVLTAGAFITGLFVNPPYGFAPEDNLAYAHVIRLHQVGIAQLTKRYPDATVLTAWPVSDELRRPELGYVKHPWDVYPIDDFSAAQIDRAAQEPGRYSAALVFSTKYDPPPLLNLGSRSQLLDERYFGLHHDMSPEAIAHQLGGTMAWKTTDEGMWIAVLRFNRQFEARLEPAASIERIKEMRKAVPIVIGVLVLLAGLFVFNLWRAVQEPVVSTPGPYEVGRQNLHNQLEDLKKSDAQIEQKAWNVIPALRALIAVHQDRIAKFTGNSQAGEILAYEHDSVTRLEKRITDLEAQVAAQAEAAQQAAKDAAQEAAREGKPEQK